MSGVLLCYDTVVTLRVCEKIGGWVARCQVGRPVLHASKKSQPNICRVRRTMII